MDTEGIDVAVIYPSRDLFALTIPDMDPRLAAAMARAYNTWLHAFCQENPNRRQTRAAHRCVEIYDVGEECRDGL